MKKNTSNYIVLKMCAFAFFLLFTNNISAQTYCTPTPANMYNQGITNVSFSTVNNTTGNEAGNYGDYSAQVGSGIQGETVGINITLDTRFQCKMSIWIDWNNNGLFTDPSEKVYDVVALAATTLNATFTIPIGASLGNHRIRIGGKYAGYAGPTDPCYTGNYGTYEDYTLNVLPIPPCATPTATASNLTFITNNQGIVGNFTDASPIPDNYLVVMNTSGTPPNIIDGTDYTIGNDLGGGNIVIDNDSNTTFNATSIFPNTTYFFFVFSFNDDCVGGPLYKKPSLTDKTNTSASCFPVLYCENEYPTIEPITNVTFAAINNTSAPTSTTAHERFCITTDVNQGDQITISVNGNTAGNFVNGIVAYFDWNQNSSLETDNVERTVIGILNNNNGTGIPATATIQVPLDAQLGSTTMRIVKTYNTYSLDSCNPNSDYGQTEDYLINVIGPIPCVSPTSQPTGLNLNVAGTIVDGDFTAAAPAPNSYVVVRNTTGVIPILTDGLAYNIGDLLPGGNVIVDNDDDTAFTTAVIANTTHYFYVFSYNQYCGGGPLYYNTTPLQGNITSGACSTTSTDASVRYIDDVEFIGTLNDVSNFGNGFDTSGYQNFSAQPNSSQQQGEGMNVYVAGNFRGHLKAWVDWNQDGNFDNATENVYDSRDIATTSTTFGYAIPFTQPIGTYSLRVRFYNSFSSTLPNTSPFFEEYGYDFDACEVFDMNGDYVEYGEAEDYTFDVVSRCQAELLEINNGEACGTSEPVTISVVGDSNIVSYKWYADEFGGPILGTTNTGEWTTPPVTATTTFWVTANNGVCDAYERERVIAFLNAPALLTFTPSIPFICGENSPPVEIEATSTTQIEYLIDEDFETGLGSFTNDNIEINTVYPGQPDPNIASQWTPRTSVYIANESVWFPAISSGFGPNNFVLANGDTYILDQATPPEFIENALVSSQVDATYYNDLTLELDMYFSRYNINIPEYVNIEASNDGGLTWDIINNITDDIGYGTEFQLLTYDLSAYAGEGNLSIRVHYYGQWGDGVAVDNIKLYGTTSINPLATWSQPPDVLIYKDPAGTIVYDGDKRSKIYVLPSIAELQASSTWSFTADVVLENGCSANGTVFLENRTKYFTGSDNDWNTASNWSPVGIPDATNCIIIPDTYSANISNTVDGEGYSLDIQDTGTLDIQPNGSVTIQNFVNVDNTGKFTIEDSGSLIQVQDQTDPNYVANTGNIDMKRITNIRKLDYVYWSTPVANFPITSISPLTPNGLIWNWIPTTIQGYAGDFGIWQNANENMINGKGYAVRGPNDYNTTFQNYTASFNGVPNNGIITKSIKRGIYTGVDYTGPTSTMVTNTDDNLNLVGNPYPSEIDAQIFLSENTFIEGAIHIWTHGIAPSNVISDPFYDDYVLNYSINDYLTYNSTGASTGAGTFNGYISSGQGFFITMEDNATTDELITFKNSMRNKTYSNNEFYKIAETDNEINKHRIWLDLVNSDNINNRILVGYVDGATNSKDRLYDAYNINKTNFSLYSKAEENKLLIQGRSTPFLVNDKVEIEVVLPDNGLYRLALHEVDGLFEDENQGIYIEDTKLKVIHNIKETPYEFTGDIGKSKERFLLRYTDGSKPVEENEEIIAESIEETIETQLSIFSFNQKIKAISKPNKIINFLIYDISGKLLLEKQNLDTNEYIVETNNISSGTYLVVVKLEDGRKITKKIIF
jgi:hypothetical protein